MDIQVSVTHDNDSQNINVAFYKHVDDTTLHVYNPVKSSDGIKWVWVEVVMGATVQPTFAIPAFFTRTGVVQEMVDQFAKNIGIVATQAKDSLSVVETQSKHLDDLRRLLFDGDYIEMQSGKKPAAVGTKERV